VNQPKRVLDLFCGAGGVGAGLHRAWPDAEIVGVDIKPQPRYPFRFVQADALTYPTGEFDFIWASPPCQAYSVAAQTQRNQGKEYPDLVIPIRAKLEAAGVPYIIENVPGAPIRADVKICGCQVGLKIRRVRWFETSWRHFEAARGHLHTGPVVSVVGHGTPSWVREKLGFNPTIHHYRKAMGIDWMTRAELSQAIPPAYSEYLAKAFMEANP
jgi:DNA (cytosine-5)-methyltransferase 1